MDIEVATGDLERVRLVDPAPRTLALGEARLRVDRFGLSSNNITYAVTGDLLRYWECFPASAPDAGDPTRWGRVPVWGFADVVETRSDDVAVGERLFGYLPMSDELVIETGKAGASTVDDVAGHRAGLAGPYNAYRRCAADPVWRRDGEDLQMLLYPLFFTAFVLDDFLADHDDAGAEQVVVSSASAKTSVGEAFLTHARGRRVVGLTSAGNAEFCQSLGVYDEVVTYDAVDGLDRVPSVYLDVSGNRDVLGGVHRRLEGVLAESVVVGDTHWDHRATDEGVLPGPRPEFFFAPAHVTKRSAEWGPDELARRLGDAWERFTAWVPSWLHLEEVAGPGAVAAAYLRYLRGPRDPQVGTVCRPRKEGDR